MKAVNSHIFKANALSKNSPIPKNPKVILLGSPNVNLKLFAHRMGIDFGVCALSLKQMYKTILAYEESYSNQTFYRNVIKILKNPDINQSIKELEANNIPEKLIALTKYSEKGFILYDYPNTLSQAKSLERNTNGGVNLVINLMMKKEVGLSREASKHKCENCDRVYFKSDFVNQEEGYDIKGFFPENGVCIDCGSHKIVQVSDNLKFNERYDEYEKKLLELGSFYNTLGLLSNFEVKAGLDDYEEIRRRIVTNFKH